MKKIQIKDVFILKPFDLSEAANWCRDNYFLVTRSDDNKRFIFVDSYWGFTDQNAKRLTLKDLHKLGHIHFYFNVGEVRRVEGKENWLRYKKSDRFVIPEQHGNAMKYAVRQLAQEDKETILKLIDKDIAEEKNNIKQAHRRLTRLDQQRLKVEAGELEAY